MKMLYPIMMLCLICNTSCKNQTSHIDDGIIPIEQMPLIITEVFKAEGATSVASVYENINQVATLDSILQEFGTNREKFEQSMSYYSNDLETYGKIYDSAYNIIKREKDTLTQNISKNKQ